MKTQITFYSKSHNGEKPQRRFYKLIYTAALRLGKEISLNSYKIDFDFNGEVWPEVQGHNGAKAYKGQLAIDGEEFNNIIVILKEHHYSKHHIITFWPDTQHPDAKHSYTDILVDVALSGRPYPPAEVVDKMHPIFIDNPGVNPGALLMMIYDEEKEFFESQIHGDYHTKIKEMSQDLDSVYQQLNETTIELNETKAELDKTIAKGIENAEKLIKQDEDLADANKTIAEQSEKIRKLEKGAHRPEENWAVVTRSGEPAVILEVKVVEETNRRQEKVNAIHLIMSDGSIRKNNWKNGFEDRVAFANELKEQAIPVVTDVWNSPNSPTYYKPERWFQNIHIVKDNHNT
jgi:flagellar biosynthesis chaperone FliJ